MHPEALLREDHFSLARDIDFPIFHSQYGKDGARLEILGAIHGGTYASMLAHPSAVAAVSPTGSGSAPTRIEMCLSKENTVISRLVGALARADNRQPIGAILA